MTRDIKRTNEPRRVRALARKRMLGVRIPAATELSLKTGSDSSIAKRKYTALGESVTGSQRLPL